MLIVAGCASKTSLLGPSQVSSLNHDSVRRSQLLLSVTLDRRKYLGIHTHSSHAIGTGMPTPALLARVGFKTDGLSPNATLLPSGTGRCGRVDAYLYEC